MRLFEFIETLPESPYKVSFLRLTENHFDYQSWCVKHNKVVPIETVSRNQAEVFYFELDLSEVHPQDLKCFVKVFPNIGKKKIAWLQEHLISWQKDNPVSRDTFLNKRLLRQIDFKFKQIERQIDKVDYLSDVEKGLVKMRLKHCFDSSSESLGINKNE